MLGVLAGRVTAVAALVALIAALLAALLAAPAHAASPPAPAPRAHAPAARTHPAKGTLSLTVPDAFLVGRQLVTVPGRQDCSLDSPPGVVPVAAGVCNSGDADYHRTVTRIRCAANAPRNGNFAVLTPDRQPGICAAWALMGLSWQFMAPPVVVARPWLASG